MEARLPGDVLKIFKIYFFSKFFYKLVGPVFRYFSCWFKGVLSLAKCCYPVAHKLRWHAFTRGPVKRTLARETCSVLCVLVGSPLDKPQRKPLRGPETTLCTRPFLTCCDATGNLKEKFISGKQTQQKSPVLILLFSGWIILCSRFTVTEVFPPREGTPAIFGQINLAGN